MLLVNDEVIRLMRLFENPFINRNLELILVCEENIYFRLDDVHNLLDLKCKVIAWLSRPSFKGVSEKIQDRCLHGLNTFLGTSFSKEDMDTIYTYLGNDCNRSRTISFIESNYDMDFLNTL